MMEKKIHEMEVLLEKINRLFQYLKPGYINKIDLDLMKDYTKQYYELLLEYESGKDVSIVIEEKKQEPELKKEEPKTMELPKVEKQELKYVKGGEEEEKVVMPKIDKKPEPENVAEVIHKKPLTVQEDDDDGDADERTAFGDKISKGKKTLADKLNTNGAVDLRKAIDLNDKFFFIRELFNGDHNAFDTAVKLMNSMAGFAQVKTYAEKELSEKYNWKENTESVERFYEVILEKFGG